MIVGTFIVMIWRALFRKNHPRCRHARRHKIAQTEATCAEEKAGLMEEQSDPPAYDEGDAEEAKDEDSPKL